MRNDCNYFFLHHCVTNFCRLFFNMTQIVSKASILSTKFLPKIIINKTLEFISDFDISYFQLLLVTDSCINTYKCIPLSIYKDIKIVKLSISLLSHKDCASDVFYHDLEVNVKFVMATDYQITLVLRTIRI